MTTRDRSRRGATLALLLLLPLLAGFAGKCDKSGNRNADRSPQEIAADDLLRTQVREDLTTRSRVAELWAIDIEINVFRLKVTLAGKVASEAARAEAIRLARESEVEREGVRFKAREVDAGKLKVSP
jgi:hypothetical protein